MERQRSGFASVELSLIAPLLCRVLLGLALFTATGMRPGTFAVEPSSVKTSKPQPSDIELLGVVRIDGDQRDLSGLRDKLEDGSVADQFGGLSAIEYTGVGNRFILLPDRGAGDGAVNYPCRYHEADLEVDPATGTIRWKLISSKLLSSALGKPLVGSLTACAADLHRVDPRDWTACDPEGVRRLADGTMIMSDEYGPHVFRVDELARVSDQFVIPPSFRLSEPHNGVHTSGTYPNRGLEGIAVTPSGERIIAVLQSPLVQDAKMNGYKCQGMNTRWLVFNRAGQLQQQLVYPMLDLSTCLCEILAIDEHRFLVLERDSEVGENAKIKQVFLADIRGASDVSSYESLPQMELPPEITPVHKSPWLDFLDERFGLGGKLTPEKQEGLCWGKPLPDGRRTLWVCCDNDFEAGIKTELYCFAVSGL